MTRQKLEHYRKLVIEKRDLEHRIATYTPKQKEQVADTAKDYRTGYPHTIKITGYGDSVYTKLRNRWFSRLAYCINEIDAIEAWIDTVPDPELRVILRMYYTDGYTQEQVAEAMCLERSTISKKIAAAFEEGPHD